MDAHPAAASTPLSLQEARWQPVARLIAGALAILLALSAALGVALWLSRANHERQARQGTQIAAASLAAALEAMLRQIDQSLATVANAHRQMAVLAPAERDAQLERLVPQQVALLPYVDRMRLTDAAGWVRLGLRAGERPVQVADRDYFAAARRHDALVMSEPLQGRIDPRWGVILARRLQDAEGRFEGVVYTFLPSEQLTRWLARVPVGRTGEASLRAASRALLAQHAPGRAEPPTYGSPKVSDELARAMAGGSAAAEYTAVAAHDGVERLNAVQRVGDFPLVVVVGMGHDELLTPWRREALMLGTLWLLVAALTVLLGASAIRQHRREVALRQAADRLTVWQGLMLDNELVGMARLRERRAVWNNPALEAMFGYAPGELAGMAARQLYPDDAAYEALGQAAYPVLARSERFRTQLPMRRKDGAPIWVDLSGAALGGGESLWTFVDISAIKQSEAMALELALTDALTGLANRRLFDQQCELRLADARRSGRTLALAMVDLDGFKPVNDRHGHAAGDAVLVAVAGRLLASVRATDVAARLGGDEFALLLSDVEGAAEARQVLERALAALREPIVLPDGQQARVGASIGAALTVAGRCGAAALAERADALLYEGKRAGKGVIHLASADDPS